MLQDKQLVDILVLLMKPTNSEGLIIQSDRFTALLASARKTTHSTVGNNLIKRSVSIEDYLSNYCSPP